MSSLPDCSNCDVVEKHVAATKNGAEDLVPSSDSRSTTLVSVDPQGE
jgi:hypothetical protein